MTDAMSKLTQRRILRILILGVWSVMLALLVHRLRTQPSVPRIDVGTPAPEASDEWMGVYQEGRRIGFTHRALVPAATGITLFEESLLRLKVLDAERTVRTVVHARLDLAYALQHADVVLQSEGSSFQALAEVGTDSLVVRVDFGSTQSSYTLPLQTPIFLPQSLRASLRGAELDEARELRAAVWDPLTSRREEIVVRVIRQEPVPEARPAANAWRVEEELHGVKTTAWLNEEGEVVREEGPLGLALVRTTREAALAEVPPGAAMDIAKQASVPVGRIEAPRTRARLRVRLQGAALGEIPSDAEQSLSGDVVTIERSRLSERDTYVLPFRGGDERDLAATVFLQSDHPRVRGLARQVLDGEVDAQRAARRLENWVYAYVEKTPTISIPNALQVIDSARGDCNEHAVLFAALARASGLPTRVVAGLVYDDDAFLYHAWCEVWLGRWVAVDPALHQFPADATHIKLVEGGPEKHSALLSVVGKLKIEVLDGRE